MLIYKLLNFYFYLKKARKNAIMKFENDSFGGNNDKRFYKNKA